MCFGGSNASEVARQEQGAREQRITAGMGAINRGFSGFTPAFFAQRRNAYIRAAMPQYQQQYKTQLGNLVYRLGNQGLLKSSAGRELGNNLSNYATQARQSIASQGLAAAQGLQRDVTQSKSNLISQLEASADPTATASQVAATAGGFSAPSPLPAIGNLFQNWSDIYMTRQANRASQPVYSASSGFAPLGRPSSVIN